MAKVDIEVALDLSKFRNELNKLPADARAGMEKAFSGLDKTLKNSMDRAVKQEREHFKSLKNSSKDLEGALGGADQFLSKLNDMSGLGIANDLGDLGKAAMAVSGALGPVGIAVGVVGAAALAAGASVLGLVLSTDELQESLKGAIDLGYIDPLPKEQQEAVATVNRSFVVMGELIKGLAMELGGGFAVEIESISIGFIAATLAFSDLVKAFISGGNLIKKLLTTMGSNMIQGLLLPITLVFDALEGLGNVAAYLGIPFGKEIAAIGNKWDDLTDHMASSLIGATSDFAGSFFDSQMGGYSERAREIAKMAAPGTLQSALTPPSLSGGGRSSKESEKVAESIAAENELLAEQNAILLANEALRAAVMEIITEELLGEDAILKKYADKQAALDELALSAEELGDYELAVARLNIEQQKELDALAAEREKVEMQRRQDALAAIIEERDLRRAAFSESMTQATTGVQLFEGTVAATQDALVSLFGETAMANSKVAQRLFRMQQAGAVAEIIISSAKAASEAMALGPIGAPIMIGLIAAQAAAQTAAVLAQKPPKFYIGGLAPDETPATLHRGEAVLNQRAVADLNAGEGAGARQEIAIVFNDRTIDKMVASAVKSNSETRRSLASSAGNFSRAKNPWS